MLIAKPPGEWLDETGRFEPDYPHAGGTGALTVAVLVWPGSAKEGLAKLPVHGRERIGSARNRAAGRARATGVRLAAFVAAWRKPDFSRGGGWTATCTDLLPDRARRRDPAVFGRCGARSIDAARLGLEGGGIALETARGLTANA